MWPIITRLFLPFILLTFGFALFIVNAIIIVIIAPMFYINLVGYGFLVAAFVLTAVNTLLTAILTIDDDTSYYRVVLRDARKKRKKEVKDYPGVIVVEVDGLSYGMLREAIESGYMNNVKKLIESETHTLKPWITDLSSQTGASQAGILHGNNSDIVAFRWVEKENNNKIVECSSLKDIEVLEERISDGNGLLADNGASRSNLFSGDAKDIILTSSKFRNFKKLYNTAWFSLYSSPSYTARIALLGLYDLIKELRSQRKHKVEDIQPRIDRDFKYASIRVGTNVFLSEANTATLIGDVMVGDIDVAYSTYLGYDEIAYHSGVEDEDSYYALRLIDKHIKRLIEGSRYASREYQFVIQSDHGQSKGATFTQRYGKTFEEFVISLLPEDMSIYANLSSQEDHHTEIFNPFSRKKDEEEEEDECIESQVTVLASGNLALINLTQWDYRLTYEELMEQYPDLIPGILDNEYIGFIVVYSQEHGNLVLSKNGKYFLDSDKIEGEDPLKNYGKNAAEKIKRHCTFNHLPDILVNSFYEAEKDEVCAFEELIGSHGGIGGMQSEPFILYPSDWKVPDGDIVGAENIYSVLKENLQLLKNNGK
ncbi:alkaline phosphatase family protein [Methanobrevibacter sp.]|uniref:alkaline phosphatase family protein n=1 Tax=Methanobrevibacter sp. TaxID=66852 RepID=UPI0038900A6B